MLFATLMFTDDREKKGIIFETDINSYFIEHLFVCKEISVTYSVSKFLNKMKNKG